MLKISPLFLKYIREETTGDKYSKMSIEEKRTYYKCGKKYFTLDHLEPWSLYSQLAEDMSYKKSPKMTPSYKDFSPSSIYKVDEEINWKISIWKGDITTLEVDSVVNAANSSLLGGGGVDGAIHSASGKDLAKYCSKLGGCLVGEAKCTPGFRLPAKYIIHTVGPQDQNPSSLLKCYSNCLSFFCSEDINSMAFCCISTGIYGYPNDKAAKIALETTRKYLQRIKVEDKVLFDKIQRIIFCVFLQEDLNHYINYLHKFFPLPPQTKH